MHANLHFAAVSPPWKASQMTEAETAPPNTPSHDWNTCFKHQIPKQSPSTQKDSSSIGNNASLFLILCFFSKSVWKTPMFFPEGPVTSELVPRVHGGTQVSREKMGWGNWRGWHGTGSHAGSGEKAAGWTSTGSRGKAPRGKSGGPGARQGSASTLTQVPVCLSGWSMLWATGLVHAGLYKLLKDKSLPCCKK